MKIIQFEGTPEEFNSVSHFFSNQPDTSAVAPQEQPNRPKPPTDNPPSFAEAIRSAVLRLPPSEGQKKLYQVLKSGPLSADEIRQRTGWDDSRLRGAMGALGKRMNGTSEVHAAGLPGNSAAILKWSHNGTDWVYELQPYALEVLREEGLI